MTQDDEAESRLDLSTIEVFEGFGVLQRSQQMVESLS